MANHDDPMTLMERYAAATDGCESRDLLVAAGWTRDGLGTRLYRLLREYDRARSTLGLGRDLTDEQSDERAALAGRAKDEANRERTGAATGRIARDKLVETFAQAEQFAMGRRAEAMTRLRTLPECREQLGQFASRLATRRRFMQADVDPAAGGPGPVMLIAGRVLGYWIDPTCGVCHGRGQTGGYSTPAAICTECRGTGRRRLRLAIDTDGNEFGLDLLAELERKVSWVHNAIRFHLRQDEPEPGHHLATRLKRYELGQHLTELRSVEAQKD